jgi:hypothetical protein
VSFDIINVGFITCAIGIHVIHCIRWIWAICVFWGWNTVASVVCLIPRAIILPQSKAWAMSLRDDKQRSFAFLLPLYPSSSVPSCPHDIHLLFLEVWQCPNACILRMFHQRMYKWKVALEVVPPNSRLSFRTEGALDGNIWTRWQCCRFFGNAIRESEQVGASSGWWVVDFCDEELLGRN